MTINVGVIDRLVRLVIGVALIAAPLVGFMGLGAAAPLAITLMAVGAILTLTSVFGICPLYSVIGFSTSKT